MNFVDLTNRNEVNKETPRSGLIHSVLAYSYGVYFIGLLIGILIDVLSPVYMEASYLDELGFTFLILGTLLIYWAQSTSRGLGKKVRETGGPSHTHFRKGPYIFSRSPTHLGLAILTIGFGLLASAFSVIVTSALSYLITMTIFIRREEALLEEKYGESYRKYKELTSLKIRKHKNASSSQQRENLGQ